MIRNESGNEGKEESEGSIEGLSDKKRKQRLGEEKERMQEGKRRKKK